MLQNTSKTLGFKNIMVYKTPSYLARGLRLYLKQILDSVSCFFSYLQIVFSLIQTLICISNILSSMRSELCWL